MSAPMDDTVIKAARALRDALIEDSPYGNTESAWFWVQANYPQVMDLAERPTEDEGDQAGQTKEYGFDVTLSAVIRVKASSEEEARRILSECASEMDCNGGAWPSGDPILFSAYIVGGSELIKIDGEAV